MNQDEQKGDIKMTSTAITFPNNHYMDATLNQRKLEPAQIQHLDRIVRTSNYELMAARIHKHLVTVTKITNPFLRSLDCETSASKHKQFRNCLSELMTLHHPNIGKVYGWYIEDGCYHIVEEYCPGKTLKHFATHFSKHLITDKLEIASQLCAAVSHLGKKDIVHGFLHPNNIRIDVANNFNTKLAHLSHFAMKRYLLGINPSRFDPLPFIAPEQLVTGHAWTPLTDVHTTAQIVHFLFTGKSPLSRTGDRVQALKNLESFLYKAPAALGQLRVLKAPWEIVFNRALTLNPELRYPNANHFCHSLSQCFFSPYNESHRAKIIKIY